MSRFKHKYVVLQLPQSGNIRTTLSSLGYYSDLVSQEIVVPAGLQTDLGSIPAVLQWLFPKDGKAVFGYILHDYLYKVGTFSRDISDDILEEAMKVLGVSWWRRKGVRAGLKVGGWVAWNKHRKNDKKEEK